MTAALVALTYVVQALGYVGILWGVALLVLSGPRKPTDQEDHQLLDGQEPGLPGGRHGRW